MDFKTFLRPGRGTADLSWLLADSVAFHELIDRIVDLFEDVEVDKVVCIEGKGLVFGAAVARTLRKGVILLRRRSKLRSKAYVLDYIDYSGGRKTLGVLDDLVLKGERVLIIDDWIETGGTMKAAISVIEEVGGRVVGVGVFMDDSNDDLKEHLSRYNYKYVDHVLEGDNF